MTTAAAPAPRYECPAYRLECAADRPYVTLRGPAGERCLELFVPSSVHTAHGQDDTVATGAFTVEHQGADAVVTLDARSSVWRRKTYRFVCTPERIRFEIEVEGEGDLTDVHYFGGHHSALVRWGSGYAWSGTSLVRGFNPEPTVDEQPYFPPAAGSLIDATGVPLPGRSHWFFTPPPYCFAFEREGGGWIGMGVEAEPGRNGYGEYRYHAQRGAFHLTLAFDGRTSVSGTLLLPAIGIDFAADPYAVLAAHAAALRARGAAPARPRVDRPAWWRRPIFCGWGAQCHLATRDGGRASDHATEGHYRDFLARLAEHGVVPGTVVIDDKWQATYGENAADPAKWPRLRAFVDEQHEAGRRVLLWLKAWDPEGLPLEECVTNAAGTAVGCDPTNPACEARLRASVRRMLTADGYDADGFKLDFTARMPTGPGLTSHGDAWGLELMKAYLSILHGEAKAAKRDALVITHTPHPYLADVLDMIRLNDINVGSDVPRAMRHRARVAAAACPEALVDTDNWPLADRAAWRGYLEVQRELGVPALYLATHLDTTGEPLLPEDYDLIRRVWGGSR
jgi:hypothetical protein